MYVYTHFGDYKSNFLRKKNLLLGILFKLNIPLCRKDRGGELKLSEKLSSHSGKMQTQISHLIALHCLQGKCSK